MAYIAVGGDRPGTEFHAVSPQLADANPDTTTIAFDDDSGHVVIVDHGPQGIEAQIPVCLRLTTASEAPYDCS